MKARHVQILMFICFNISLGVDHDEWLIFCVAERNKENLNKIGCKFFINILLLNISDDKVDYIQDVGVLL